MRSWTLQMMIIHQYFKQEDTIMMGIFYESQNDDDHNNRMDRKEDVAASKAKSGDHSDVNRNSKAQDKVQKKIGAKSEEDIKDKNSYWHAVDAVERHDRRHSQHESVDIWGSIEMK